MNLRNLLAAATLVAISAFSTLGSAQAHLPNLKNKLKVHKERLPRPSHRLLVVHPRRLAVVQHHKRRQVRIQSDKDRHNTRKSIRSVTHKLTKPHHPKR